MNVVDLRMIVLAQQQCIPLLHGHSMNINSSLILGSNAVYLGGSNVVNMVLVSSCRFLIEMWYPFTYIYIIFNNTSERVHEKQKNGQGTYLVQRKHRHVGKYLEKGVKRPTLQSFVIIFEFVSRSSSSSLNSTCSSSTLSFSAIS